MSTEIIDFKTSSKLFAFEFRGFVVLSFDGLQTPVKL